MSRRGLIRVGALLTLAVAAVAVGTAVALGATRESSPYGPDPEGESELTGGFEAGIEHVVNQPAMFTFTSCTLVLIASAWLAIKPASRSPVLHSIRIAGLICIVITGLVFNVILRDDAPLDALQRAHDTAGHVILPILTPLVALLCGPYGQVTWRRILGSMVVPIAWVTVTLVRAPIISWVPYPFLDYTINGWGTPFTYVGVILVFYLVLAAGIWLVDRAVARRALPTPTHEA